MLHIYEIPLHFPKGKRVHPSMGSIFHGALMECIPAAVATAFHGEGRRPYSQAVFFDEATKQSLWRMGLMNDETYEVFYEALQRLSDVYLKQQGYTVRLGKKRHREWDVMTYLQQRPVPKRATLSFVTTTSFKRDGTYVLFPESELLYQSVANRWSLLTSMDLEPQLHRVLGYYTIIEEYNLRTERFHLEGHHVHGFSGTIQLRFGGPPDTARLAAALLQCAAATGVGVKTALGMGAVHCHIE